MPNTTVTRVRAPSARVHLPRRWFPPSPRRPHATLSVDENSGVLTVRGRASRRGARYLLAGLQSPARKLGLPEGVVRLAVERWAASSGKSSLRLAPLAKNPARDFETRAQLVAQASSAPTREELNHLPRWEEQREQAAAALGALARFLPTAELMRVKRSRASTPSRSRRAGGS